MRSLLNITFKDILSRDIVEKVKNIISKCVFYNHPQEILAYCFSVFSLALVTPNLYIKHLTIPFLSKAL